MGLLERDIPTRTVKDSAISLEPLREIPLYQAVSNYVSHFYRLVQKEQRSCNGFLMTLYRRHLTSSFYAIKSSLRRHSNADITEIQKPIATAPFTPESIEQLFTTSTILHSKGITFTQSQTQIWEILYKQQNYIVTFYPDVYHEKPSLRLMNFGEPLFEELLSTLAKFGIQKN